MSEDSERETRRERIHRDREQRDQRTTSSGFLHSDERDEMPPKARPPKLDKQARGDKLMNTKRRRRAYMQDGWKLNALDLMRFEARRQGLPMSAGKDIVLTMEWEDLMKLFQTSDRSRVGRILSWLENHGWIECERKRRTDGKRGRRTGRYILGRIAAPVYTEGELVRAKRTVWKTGRIM